MRYEKYKKSISPFLEEIPFHWKETYLSHAYSLSSDTGHTEEQLLSVFLDKGVVSYSSTDQKQVHKPSEDMSKYQLVNPGDFVINNQQAWRGSVGISRYKGIVSPAYYIWRPRKDNNPYYMNYLFRDHYIIDQFVLASKGVGSIQRQVYVPYISLHPSSRGAEPDCAVSRLAGVQNQQADSRLPTADQIAGRAAADCH